MDFPPFQAELSIIGGNESRVIAPANTDPRKFLMHVYRTALKKVHGRLAVKRNLDCLAGTGPVYVASIGKAAEAMMLGALDRLDERTVRALVITKRGHLTGKIGSDHRLTCLEAAHPIPDQTSLEAGEALVRFIEQVPIDAQLLFLISGGASSLVEVLPAGIGLDKLIRLNAWLLASGLPIGAINSVRCAVSCIKGGRLAQVVDARRALVLLISDVPDNNPAVIGSGLLAPPGSKPDLPAGLPRWITALVDQAPSVPAAAHPGIAAIEHHIIATNQMVLDGIINEYKHEVIDTFSISGDAATAGTRLADWLIDARPGLYLGGGETTVRLPDAPGQGGRCQQLALAAAMTFSGHRCIHVLAAGTDGTDGPGGAAGALVDGGTVERGTLQGLDARQCIDAADAGRFLHASGDIITTGPTGTNVMDVIIGLKTLCD